MPCLGWTMEELEQLTAVLLERAMQFGFRVAVKDIVSGDSVAIAMSLSALLNPAKSKSVK